MVNLGSAHKGYLVSSPPPQFLTVSLPRRIVTPQKAVGGIDCRRCHYCGRDAGCASEGFAPRRHTRSSIDPAATSRADFARRRRRVARSTSAASALAPPPEGEGNK